MNEQQFWKNFRLGKELDISGRFIYNGLRYFSEIETLYYDEEIFEILYNLSVGLERLIKIAVILIEHDENLDQDEFEKSLISHTHLDLLKRVRKKHTLTIAGPHNDFLALLSTFYKTHRYGRYSISSVSPSSQEKKLFHSYLEKQLRVEIKDVFPFNITSNDDKFRQFIGNIVGKIATNLFEIISKEALRLNIYTNEIRYNSKAAKVFLTKQFEFTKENVLWKELLIYFMSTDDVSGHLDFIKSIEPLGFDPTLVRDYLQCFFSDEKKIDVIGELEDLYLEIEKPEERLDQLRIIGDPNVIFDIDEDEIEDA
jgi:hypothetical protein